MSDEYFSYESLSENKITHWVIENGASIRNAIIAEGCVIRAGAKIGGDVVNGERRISVIGKEKEISEGTVIEPGAIV